MRPGNPGRTPWFWRSTRLVGFVDSAVKIRDKIVSCGLKTIAYVNPRAWSAGALIAIACDKIP